MPALAEDLIERLKFFQASCKWSAKRGQTIAPFPPADVAYYSILAREGLTLFAALEGPGEHSLASFAETHFPLAGARPPPNRAV